MIFPCFFPWYSHDFPIIFQWFSHYFPMIFPWFSHDFPIIFSIVSWKLRSRPWHCAAASISSWISGPGTGTSRGGADAEAPEAPAAPPGKAMAESRARNWKGVCGWEIHGGILGIFFSGFFRMELFGGNPNPVPECDGHLNRKSLVFFFHLVTCPFCLVHLRTGMISLAKMTWFDHGETENFRGDRPISIQKLGTFTNKTFKTWEMWKWTKWTHKMSRISTLSTGSSSWLSSGCPWLSSGALSKTEEAARSAARLGRAKKGAVLIIQRYHLVTHGKMTLFRL